MHTVIFVWGEGQFGLGNRLTRDEFIARANVVHNGKYDYSRVKYVNVNTKVEIVCPEHGSFFQTPKRHMRGVECFWCSRAKRRVSMDEFVRRAKAVHGDKYDYSRVVYVGCETEVEIVCPEHGSFFQTPKSHWEGNGCSRCSGLARSSTGEFVLKAKDVHGDKYDYSKVDYVNNKVHVEIICPKHGSFLQSPNSHLRGAGCPVCAGTMTSDTCAFIEKARAVHGCAYDYSRVSYKNSKTPVEIVCPVHGSFMQTPSEHLSGRGCLFCGYDRTRCARRSNRDEFIARAKAAHGDKYDYSKVDYVNASTKVEIICPKHGSFRQTPAHHLSNHGCPGCSRETAAKTMRERYGADSYVQTEEYRRRAYVTKKMNCTFGSSQAERNMVARLREIFGKADVKCQYSDDVRYPYAVDAYVESRDMFVELNAYWSHGKHWFDSSDDADKAIAERWSVRSENKRHYAKSLDVWTCRDVEKRETARENNLNYVVFWDTDLKDFEEWVDVGCPDSHDWEREYAWRFGPEARKADTRRGEESDRTTLPERVQPAPDVA